MPTVQEMLTESFRALPKPQKDRLLYHAERYTPILRGEEHNDTFCNGRGAACPSVLACVKNVPTRKIAGNHSNHPSWYNTLQTLRAFCETKYGRKFDNLLRHVTETQCRQAFFDAN